MEPPRIYPISQPHFPRNEGHRPAARSLHPANALSASCHGARDPQAAMRGWPFTPDAPSRPASDQSANTSKRYSSRRNTFASSQGSRSTPALHLHTFWSRALQQHHFWIRLSIFKRVKNQELSKMLGPKTVFFFCVFAPLTTSFQTCHISTIFAARNPTNSKFPNSGSDADVVR